MSSRFAGKVVIVTGGASGIGLATVRRLSAEGAQVVIADLDVERAAAAAAMLAGADGTKAWPVACDVSRESDVEAAVADTMRRAGRLDLVVNNAGLMRFGSLVELTHDDWMKTLAVDLMGPFYFIRAAFRCMKRGGAVVNVASVHAVETSPGVAPYAAAKAALLSLTRSAAIEGAPLGIRVNAVVPGAVDTPMLWQNPNLKSGAETLQPGDVGRPEDVAAAIAFLGSDDAAFVQGAALRVDGGRLARL